MQFRDLKKLLADNRGYVAPNMTAALKWLSTNNLVSEG